MGFPAGLERTIVVDLTGKLPAGAHTHPAHDQSANLLGSGAHRQPAEAEARTTEVPLATATLHFRGYPTQIDGASPGDLDYDYDRVSLTGPFQHQRGNYTRMGDVTALVQAPSTTASSSSAAAKRLPPSSTPPRCPRSPPHWKRDYFFYANGFVKDMDWWDGSPFTVGATALPRHEHLSLSREREATPTTPARSTTSSTGTTASTPASTCTPITSTTRLLPASPQGDRRRLQR